LIPAACYTTHTTPIHKNDNNIVTKLIKFYIHRKYPLQAPFDYLRLQYVCERIIILYYIYISLEFLTRVQYNNVPSHKYYIYLPCTTRPTSQVSSTVVIKGQNFTIFNLRFIFFPQQAAALLRCRTRDHISCNSDDDTRLKKTHTHTHIRTHTHTYLTRLVMISPLIIIIFHPASISRREFILGLNELRTYYYRCTYYNIGSEVPIITYGPITVYNIM